VNTHLSGGQVVGTHFVSSERKRRDLMRYLRFLIAPATLLYVGCASEVQTVGSPEEASWTAPDGGVRSLGTDGSTLDDSGPIETSDAMEPDPGPLPDSSAEQGGSLPDSVATSDLQGAAPDGTSFTCTPKKFVKCAGNLLLRCNATGDDLETEDCSPYTCNPVEKRCNTCHIGSQPTCSGDYLVSCSDAGLPVVSPCPLGCVAGQCSSCKDADKDGYGVGPGCNAADCDDASGAIHPGATESCNGKDDDCDGAIDEGFDQDKDGYLSCSGDCDDGDPAIHPGAVEVCDNVDNNCNGSKDEALTRSCYTGPTATAGVGTCKSGSQICSAGVWGPCNGSVGPAVETCDGKDNDCDGVTDEDVTVTYYGDSDGDGWGDPADPIDAGCDPPPEYIGNNKDCNDDDPDVNPAQTSFFKKPAKLSLSYDYNCDGVEEKQYTDVTDCDGACGDIAVSGWANKVPDCGEKGTWATCVLVASKCQPKGSVQTQACR
jgi:hypothetical protein